METPSDPTVTGRSEQRTVAVFVYGLFMDVDLLRARGVDPQKPEAASVPGMALRIGQRASLVDDPRSCVYGIVVHLTPHEIDHLYAEPSVSAYRPAPVLTRVAGGTYVPAIAYVLPVPPDPTESNPEYATKLRVLAERLQLPRAYVETIR